MGGAFDLEAGAGATFYIDFGAAPKGPGGPGGIPAPGGGGKPVPGGPLPGGPLPGGPLPGGGGIPLLGGGGIPPAGGARG